MGWKSKTLVSGLLCVAALSFGLSARAQVRAGDEKGETDTRKWVIVEVTPAWRAKGRGMSEQAIRARYARHVRVTGWLYYEPDAGQPDPRGTRWEIHPVTSIVAIR